MPMFRKKPVVVEAMQVPPPITPDNAEEHTKLAVWLIESGREWSDLECENGYDIHTLEGVMRANPGDWIIKGVQGELYPCKPDIFEATYEPEKTNSEKIVDALLKDKESMARDMGLDEETIQEVMETSRQEYDDGMGS